MYIIEPDNLIPDEICMAQVGGVPAVLKYLLEKGFIDGSCLTGMRISSILICISVAVLYVTYSGNFSVSSRSYTLVYDPPSDN